MVKMWPGRELIISDWKIEAKCTICESIGRGPQRHEETGYLSMSIAEIGHDQVAEMPGS